MIGCFLFFYSFFSHDKWIDFSRKGASYSAIGRETGQRKAVSLGARDIHRRSQELNRYSDIHATVSCSMINSGFDGLFAS